MTYAKVKITAQIRLETGLHIGTSNAFAAIGATDSPVIKDPITNYSWFQHQGKNENPPGSCL